MGSSAIRYASTKLAPYYGKRYGALTSTGMAAIEVALALLGIAPGDEVVVPADCCYLVPAAVRKAAAIPIFAAIDEYLTLDPIWIKRALTSKTKAVIAVHHLGLPCPVRRLRINIPSSIPLIEDAAQAFDLRSEGEIVGVSSDVVVTSFGEGKALDLMGGGGVFADDAVLENLMDRQGSIMRSGTRLPHSCPLHTRAVDDLECKLEVAARNVGARRNLVSQLTPVLREAGLRPWHGRPGDQPSWHRLPVVPESFDVRLRASCAHSFDKVIQYPHEVPLCDLPLFTRRDSGLGIRCRDTHLYVRLDDQVLLEQWLSDLKKGSATWSN